MSDPWVQTVSGVAFDLLAPRAEDVKIGDILHALSRLSRYAGHTIGSRGYSVAEHSCLVERLLGVWGCPAAVRREGLLHDAPEAYYGDVSSPMKAAIRVLMTPAANVPARESPLDHLCWCVDRVVRPALGLPTEETPIVKRADLVALAIERRDLMAPCDRDWNLPEYAPPAITLSRVCWDPDRAVSEMRERLATLDAEIAEATP